MDDSMRMQIATKLWNAAVGDKGISQNVDGSFQQDKAMLKYCELAGKYNIKSSGLIQLVQRFMQNSITITGPVYVRTIF